MLLRDHGCLEVHVELLPCVTHNYFSWSSRTLASKMAAGIVHSASRPEYMNATPHHSKLRATITLSSPLYVAGEELTGKMEMECRADSGVGIGLIMVELFAVQGAHFLNYINRTGANMVQSSIRAIIPQRRHSCIYVACSRVPDSPHLTPLLLILSQANPHFPKVTFLHDEA